jgi:hypothetical protein
MTTDPYPRWRNTAIQVGLGFAAHAVPALGWLHGITALALFALAGYTARLASRAPASAAHQLPSRRRS